MKKLSTDEQIVLFNIPEGKKNAISRAALAAGAGYSDRTIRRIIAQLQEKGYMICNLSGGAGYFIAVDPDDVSDYYRQEKARAVSIFKRIRPMRNYLRREGRAV